MEGTSKCSADCVPEHEFFSSFPCGRHSSVRTSPASHKDPGTQKVLGTLSLWNGKEAEAWTRVNPSLNVHSTFCLNVRLFIAKIVDRVFLC